MMNGSLYSVIFELYSEGNATVPKTVGHLTQALFLNLVKQYDPVLAKRLHDEPGYRPYTVSPLSGGEIVGERMTLFKGQLCCLRITLLDGGILWNALQAHFREAGPIHVHLGNTNLQLVRMLSTSPTDHLIWVSSTDWQTLVTLPVQSTMTLHFSTATAFSLGERQFCLFPEPLLVWGSLLRDWNRYAPEYMYMEKRAIRESLDKHIAVTACALSHAYLHFPGYVQKGFIGRCTYRLNTDQPLAAQLISLAAFAHYAGIGYKTTMGMGQVKVEFSEGLSG